MLPAGKYVVEMIVPPGYELVKEEDKNILIGDNYIAPVSQEFAGLGNIFILPDQAWVHLLQRQQRSEFGQQPRPDDCFRQADTGSVEDETWPCVGQTRIVPDYMSLFPGIQQVAPFAGAKRPLCDRKEVVLADQPCRAATKFFIYTKNPIAGKFTGMMTNDMASEFDTVLAAVRREFGAPNLPVNMRDFMGTEMSRVYGDQWGVYNGMYFSTWEVNPPNPTGYAPQMSIACMNDPGTGASPDAMRCTTRNTATSAMRFRSCLGRPSTWTRPTSLREPPMRSAPNWSLPLPMANHPLTPSPSL